VQQEADDEESKQSAKAATASNQLWKLIAKRNDCGLPSRVARPCCTMWSLSPARSDGQRSRPLLILKKEDSNCERKARK
jgi:hypothetical protein